MKPVYFLGIDIGTYESKGVIMDGECRVAAAWSEKHGLENPRPHYFEHDALAVWWGDFCKISKALLREANIRNTQIAAIGASTLGADLLPVDRCCRPLRKAIVYGIDARADKEIAYLYKLFGEEKVLEFNGRPLCSNDIPPKILWLKNNEPEVYNSAYKFLTGSSYLTAKLTGHYVIDRFLGLGAFSPLYNLDTGQIDETYCPLFCRPDQLADLCETTDIAGTVTEQAAAETGLAAGTPVIAGTDDSGAEAISIGILEKGDMMVQLGSTMYMIGITEKKIRDSRVWSGGFIVPGTYSVQGGTNTAGTFTRWYRDNVFSDLLRKEEIGGANAYDGMLDGLAEIPPGSDGLVTLPYLSGERTPLNDPLARGVVFGLQLKHTRRHLYRSALESVGYSLAQHLSIFEENGVNIKNIVAVGGGTKSPVWLQVIADITGKVISTSDVGIGASFGDAAMAAIGVGHFHDFMDFRKYIAPGKSYAPNRESHRIYRHYQRIFDELYLSTKNLMHALPYKNQHEFF